MNAPVDVLAVMDFLTTAYVANKGTSDQFISCITPQCHGDDKMLRKDKYGAAWLDLIEASAAVAELIEADREFDEARDACCPDLGGSSERLVRAKARRAAALARVGGGK